MKIKVTIGGNDRLALILPVENAGLAAELLALAKVFERDGYYATSGWKPAEESIRIEYTDGAELEPTSAKTQAAQEEAARQQKNWLEEYSKRQSLEKQVSELKAKLEELRERTTCTTTPTADPETEVEADAEDLPL